MIKFIYRVFEILSYSIKKSLLLYSKNSNKLFMLIFYIDDFFKNFINFKEQYEFLQYYFFFK